MIKPDEFTDGLDMFVHGDEGLEGAEAFAEQRKPDLSPYR